MTKEQLETAILFFAKKYDKESNYIALMKSRPGFPKLVEMISYEMFLYNFNSYYCTDDEYQMYKIIYAYATELNQKGFVNLNE